MDLKDTHRNTQDAALNVDTFKKYVLLGSIRYEYITLQSKDFCTCHRPYLFLAYVLVSYKFSKRTTSMIKLYDILKK